MEEYLLKDLTYELIGLSYKVFNKMGFGYQEKYYKRAYALELSQLGKKFVQERKCVIVYQGRKIGRYFIDFVVENKVVIEFKIANDFYLQHTKQVLGYLKASGLQLGLIVLMSKNGIRIKRIINEKSALSANKNLRKI